MAALPRVEVEVANSWFRDAVADGGRLRSNCDARFVANTAVVPDQSAVASGVIVGAVAISAKAAAASTDAPAVVNRAGARARACSGNGPLLCLCRWLSEVARTSLAQRSETPAVRRNNIVWYAHGHFEVPWFCLSVLVD